MSVQISINLNNFNAIAQGLNNSTINLSQAVGTALTNVYERILLTAQVLVPVRTGYLKSTLAVEKISDFQVRIKASADYAYYVEYGTRRMSARLFLTNAVNQHLSEFAPEIEKQILALLSQNLSQ